MAGTRPTLRYGLPYGTLQRHAKGVAAILFSAAFLVLVAYILARFATGYVN